jgi:hypothetical protein
MYKMAPVRIDDCKIPVPYADIQAADLLGWKGNIRDEEFVRLARRVKDCLSRVLSTDHVYIFPNGKANGIGIVGASGTGKTTLVEDVIQLNSSTPLLAIQGVSRGVIDSGYPLGKDASPESYVVLMRAHIEALLRVKEKKKIFLSERTLLDQFCYSRANSRLPRPAISSALIDLMRTVWLLERGYYSFYLYLPIENATRGKGKDGDVQYQAQIDSEFKNILEENRINYHEIKGAPVKRAREASVLIDNLRRELGDS